MSQIQTVPQIALREVASLIATRTDIFNLILTSKAIHDYFLPYLYRDIEVRDLNDALKLIHFLLDNTHIACTVVSLVLRPCYLREYSKKRLAGERDLANAVERLAPHLHNLEKFIWDGIEAPPSQLWASLRAGCPQLKDIGTNIGNDPLDPESELFGFSNLRSFSLTTELHYECLDPKFNRHGEQLPQALWTMIIQRSPNLESLVLGDAGATMRTKRTLIIEPLLHAHWPRLHTLSISRTCFEAARNDSVLDLGLEKAFVAFLEKHRSTLRYFKYRACGTLIFQECNLPLLQYHSCGLPSPHAFPTGHIDSLCEVDLTHEAYCGALALHRVKSYLKCLRMLKNLSIWVDFSENVQEGSYTYDENGVEHHRPVPYDQIKELQELYESCPRGLESLKLLLSTKKEETIYWRDLPVILRRSASGDTNCDIHREGVSRLRRLELKRLEVWKVEKIGDVSQRNAAILVALDEKDQSQTGSTSFRPSWLPRSAMDKIFPTGQTHTQTSPTLSIDSSEPLSLAHPSIETVVLVACFDQWREYKPVRIVQHSTIRVRHETVSMNEPELRPSATRPLVQSFNSSLSKSFAGGAGSGSSRGASTDSAAQSRTSTVITVSGDERPGHWEIFSSLFTKRWEYEITTSLSGRGKGQKFIFESRGQNKKVIGKGAAGDSGSWRRREWKVADIRRDGKRGSGFDAKRWSNFDTSDPIPFASHVVDVNATSESGAVAAAGSSSTP
ncbi:hypothetical protein GYMLUDRAFT_466528 [Collybiopsis luxurians FD-317 M1]|uniref:Uncharacterized protein n=1 Tax=Collybiopsis luxurians FD-317 M1 TaxID=944289 RepID=A0A0D0CKG4_9AGAR|nr:hypothetical protein GYMLUDRAFT_466528 [Collybiopsis luxurians FD-317 M1]